MNPSPYLSTSRNAKPASPIRVALVGVGAAGKMILRHLLVGPAWIQVVAIVDRKPARILEWIDQNYSRPVAGVETESDFAKAVAEKKMIVTDNAELVWTSPTVDLLIEATGTVEYGARVVIGALTNRKHVVLVNAELDSTLGPLLNSIARKQGVVISHTDGEEPAVALSLFRYVERIGLKPVAAGNLKGMLDQYRTPDTQRAFATANKMNAWKVTSFADGTKLSMESCILANATGFRVARRGMLGGRCAHINELPTALPQDRLAEGGLVDFALGAQPGSGAFVIVHETDRGKMGDLAYFKMGAGPFYVFYTPFHLPQIQITSTILDAVMNASATVAPVAGPVCEVATVAKRALKAGEVLDGIGGFMAYGAIENVDTFERENLLPIGVSDQCRLTADVAKDQTITYADVELPANRLCDQLRREQRALFSPLAN